MWLPALHSLTTSGSISARPARRARDRCSVPPPGAPVPAGAGAKLSEPPLQGGVSSDGLEIRIAIVPGHEAAVRKMHPAAGGEDGEAGPD
jgi:hypothetical protein